MRLLKRRDVEGRTGLRKSSIYKLLQTGEFPRPVKVGEKAVAWVETEIDDWISARIAARDATLTSRRGRAAA